jgi:hypothetical protein
MSANGGITKGKSHKEGGIPMVVKSTGQQVELEGGEGVINKRNMASDKKFEFQGKQMTTCEIASEINSANGNGVQIDCDDVTGKKYAYENGGVVFINYKEDEIMYEPIDRKYYANDKEFDSLEEAQKFLDSGGVNEDLRGAYERGLFEGGGEVKNIYVHKYNPNITLEVIEYTNKGVKGLQRNPKSLSKKEKKEGIIVNYSDSELKEIFQKKYEGGGNVKDYNSLIGKYVNIYSMGVFLPTEHQIKDVQVSGENFRHRYVTLKFDLGIAPILLDEATAFMNNQIIYVNNNKEEFGIQLMPNQYNEGGEITGLITDEQVKDLSFKMKIKNVPLKKGILLHEIVTIEEFDLPDEENINFYPFHLIYGNSSLAIFDAFGVDEVAGLTRRDCEEFINDLKAKGKTEKDEAFIAGLTNYVGDKLFMFFNIERLSYEGFANRVLPHEALHLTRSLISLFKNEWVRKNLSKPNWWEDERASFVDMDSDNEEFFAETLERTSAIAMDGWYKVTGQKCVVDENKTYAEGGNVPKANKMFHLPLELSVYVPSTQDVDKVISDSELDARVNEVSKYLATIFGGFTKSDKIGGFMSSQSELVTEEVVPVVSFATKKDYEANKNKLVTKLSEWARKWGQEAIGFEFEGDLYYVPQKFDKGGDVRDFDWYQGFKKQQLKKGTEHEMEHVDSIRKFKKKGVSDEEVAEAIAKDHLEEDENYYIELDKMESSRKLSEALNDFTKQKGYRKNSRKYNLGGSTMNAKEIVHLKFTEDFNGVIRKKDGKYMSESFFPKGKVYKFTFLFNDGRTTALEFGNTGAYILAPNDIINIVGFNEKMYGNGGSVKPYQSMSLTENDKSIMKLLTKYSMPSSFDSRERQKLATFRGTNVVNELSSSLIQKIYGLMFENHNVANPIKQLFLSNVGAGNIVSYSPKYIEKLMISFDEKNHFVEIEKEINSILNEDKRYILFNNMDIKKSDAIIHVYPNTNPEIEQLNSLLYKTEKASIGLGICEFTSNEAMNKFKTQVGVNQGSFSQNQMIMYQQGTKYINVNEGITDEGKHTLIYILHKMA